MWDRWLRRPSGVRSDPAWGARPGRVPRLRLRRASRSSPRPARVKVHRRAGKLGDARRLAAEAPRRPRRHRPHPLGHARRADRRATRTRTSTPPAASRSSTTASSRTPPSCAAALEADGVELRQRDRLRVLRAPDRRRARARRRARGGRPPACSPASRARTACSSSTPTSPDRIVVARRGSPIVLGIGDREMLVASDIAALVRYTRQVVRARRRRDRRADRRRLPHVRARGDADAAAAVHRRLVDPSDFDARRPRRTSCTRRSPSSPPPSSARCSGGIDDRSPPRKLGGIDLDARAALAIRRVGCSAAAPPTTPAWPARS